MMIVILNGPLGIGKSSLAEALSEAIDGCVHLDGDPLIAANPLPDDEAEFLHKTVCLLIPHYEIYGYRHFVISHYWESARLLGRLTDELKEIAPEHPVRRFLLTLPLDDNLERIRRRDSVRAIDELDFELQTVATERHALSCWPSDAPDEVMDVSAPLGNLVATLLESLRVSPKR